MKKCNNCLESNSDGATNCVICGEALPVDQIDGNKDTVKEVSVVVVALPPPAEPPPEVTPPVEEPKIEPPPAEPVRAAIEVYHDNELRIVHVHELVNDITLIGREDPQRDVFPDLDFAKLEDLGVNAKRVSREHLRILQQSGHYFLYIYRGSTGTQVNKEVIDESRYNKKFEIQLGDRIILGGQIRLKLVKLVDSDPNS